MKNNWFGKSLGGGISSHDFLFKKIIAPENIFGAWREFQKGKMKKTDVLEFAQRAEENLFCLISDLAKDCYAHGKYIRFIVCDPKRREIAKAPVRDRVLHHAIHRVLNPIFEPSFIFDSYSSRKEKGTHRAVKRLFDFAQKISRNHTKTVWVLQLDIKNFFDSVDHSILITLLRKKIGDEKAMRLPGIILRSYEKSDNKGIPLGNLTSQLFSNVYLDLLDQFVKRKLEVKFYLRYADDMAILSSDRNFLENCLIRISNFIEENLKVKIHPQKTSLKKWHQGIDFLGYVIFPNHLVLRTKTKRRMLKNIEDKQKKFKAGLINKKTFNSTLQSYFGVLGHCNNFVIKRKIEDIVNNVI